jgi:HAD superfamily hydrolase (TIGR01509 family)
VRSAAIGAVVWDAGGVLVRTIDQAPRRAWEARLGLELGGLERLVFRNEVAQQAAVGRGGWPEVWAWVGAHAGLSDSDRAALAHDFFSGDRLDQELAAFIRGLRSRLRTGLLTNAFRSARDEITQHWKISDAFDAIVVSAEEGFVKPDPRIYRAALERLDVAAHQALFIDDVEENVAGARSVGMQALLFVTTAQATEDVGRWLA